MMQVLQGLFSLFIISEYFPFLSALVIILFFVILTINGFLLLPDSLVPF